MSKNAIVRLMLNWTNLFGVRMSIAEFESSKKRFLPTSLKALNVYFNLKDGILHSFDRNAKFNDRKTNASD